MNIFDEILKGLPTNSNLREKVAKLEAEYAAIDTENSILKDDIRKAKVENDQLKKQLKEFTHKDDLSELDIQILQMIAAFRSAPIALIAQQLNTHIEAVEMQVNSLFKNDYIEWELDDYGGYDYRLRDKARRYLIDNNLLPPT